MLVVDATVERTLRGALHGGAFRIGEILVRHASDGSIDIRHRDDENTPDLQEFVGAEGAIELAKFDDAGNYRPLKTAPNLRHGWNLKIVDVPELHRALDYFYPGRLAVVVAFENLKLEPTPLRTTLARQTGMYRAATRISDERLNDLVANFCRSDGGCLRTILWKRDSAGAPASTILPAEKFDPAVDQFSGKRGSALPLLCQEICAPLLEAIRRAAKSE